MLVPRSVGPLAIAALALSAWLHARGISALLGEQLAVPQVTPHLSAQAPPVPVSPRSADIILARNAFDSTTGPLGIDAPQDAPLLGIPGCAGVEVVAIAAAAPPSPSLSLIRFDGEPEPLLRGVGGEIVSIDADGVVLDRGGATCAARMFHPVSPRGANPLPPVAKSGHAGVAALGPSAFAVDRAARDGILDGAADWMKTVSVRPEKVGDDVVGLRVVGIAAGSPVEGLGIHAGDVLRSVNRVPLTTTEKMLEALGHLRTDERISVVLMRGGREVQVDYDVR